MQICIDKKLTHIQQFRKTLTLFMYGFVNQCILLKIHKIHDVIIFFLQIIDVGLMDKTLSNGQEEFEIAIKKHLQGLEHEFIGHLGANFIENVFTCGAKIIGKRVGSYQNALVINEGIFNSFTRYVLKKNNFRSTWLN